jgi:hypothetical protein
MLPPTLDSVRHAQQTELLKSKRAIRFGTQGWAELPGDLMRASNDEAYPHWIDGGLTARVRRVDDVKTSSQQWGNAVALKRARRTCLVKNNDGQLSFVNELLRRQELHILAEQDCPIHGLTPTLHASLPESVIVTPWIDGTHIVLWNERRLQQFFEIGTALIEAGFFEWDFSAGNLLDDGVQLWLFDFGYMYRFDPLTQINTAGSGVEFPQFHLAERFESRNFFGYLLDLESSVGMSAVMPLFRIQKEIALQTYEKLLRDLTQRGANAMVMRHYQTICERWRTALGSDLSFLYLSEGWRSHQTDLDDDLRGHTCTPMTLRRAEWLIERVRLDFEPLRAADLLNTEPSTGISKSRGQLLDELEDRYERAKTYQVAPDELSIPQKE